MNNITIKSITATSAARTWVVKCGVYAHEIQLVRVINFDNTGRVLVEHFGI